MRLLPEIDVECGSDAEDDYRVDHVPGAPALAGGETLFRRRCAEYETLDFPLVGSFRHKRHDEAHGEAEEQHPAAEEEPVLFVEDALEDAGIGGCVRVGALVGNFLLYTTDAVVREGRVDLGGRCNVI